MKSKVPILSLTGILLLVAFLLVGPAAAQTVALDEPFNDASQFTTSSGFFSDGSGDYFGLTDGATGDFGGGAMPSALKSYSGFNGRFMTGMDLDGEGASLPIVVEWTGINISGMTSLQFSGDFAEYFDSPGDIDAADYIRLEVQIDGGGYQNLLWFSGADFSSTGGPFNGIFREDTNFDGTGDGAALGNAAQNFVKPIAGTGTTLDLRMSVSLDAGDEDFGADNFQIGEAGAPPAVQIVINEIMQNPAAVSDSAGEWFELYNAGASDVDINGWTIKDNGSDNQVINNGGPLVITAGGYLVLGINADSATNGGAPVDYQYSNFFLANGDDEVILVDAAGVEVDRVEYDGGPAFPDPNGASMSLEDPALDNSVGANWCTSTTPFGAGDRGTPGALNNCEALPLEVYIHDVQGSGPSVAITDRVLVEAIVIGDFQANDQLRGFFIQEEDDDVDGDPLTSEGIFVFCGNCDTDVSVGDQVQVTGWPGEYFAMSQISTTSSDSSVVVVSSGNPLPSASTVALPAADSTRAELTFEPVEGMLATFSDTLAVSEYFELARYGQLVLTASERPRQFTDAFEPDATAYAAFLDDLNTRRIILDDDNNIQNDAIGSPDEPYYWPRAGLSISNYIRGGDTIDNLTGIMHWSYAGQSGTDAWRVRPVLEAIDYTFTPVLPRPVQPNETGGSFKVAAFNVLNYFDTIDDGIDICGPLADMECRGADSAAELERQREKIVSAMLEMDADVIGLMEIENDAGGAVQDLVNGLNAIAGPGTFDYIDTGFIGSDAIKVALIYNTATANPVGDYAILDSSVDPNFDDTKNRPALAQTFEEIATGAKVTVAVNHLKSKGSACTDVGDPDLNDGAGNCNVTRTNAATALATWLAGDPTNSGDPDAIVIGDLNSYRMEDPIDALKAAGYTDLLDALIGPDAYTYLFDGQLGYLDYAMSNSTLTGQVAGVTPWNINADEIPVLDYNDDIEDSGEAFFERESSSLPIFEPNPYRASDHDPVLTGLNLNAPPVCSTAMPVPEELWPVNHEFVPVSIMGVTDPDGDAVMVTIDSIYQDEPVLGSGSGNTAPDGDGVGTDTAWLRAERAGGGNGRAYHVFFTADDGNYNSCSGEVIVYVPKSQGKYSPRIDDGALYDSTQP